MGRIKPTVSITLPIDLLDKVDREAALHKCSRSAVIERAGWLYFDLVWPQYEVTVGKTMRRSKMKDVQANGKPRRIRGAQSK